MSTKTTPYWREMLAEDDDPAGQRAVESMTTTLAAAEAPLWMEEAGIDAGAQGEASARPARRRVAESAGYFDAANDVLAELAEDGASVPGEVRAGALRWAAEQDGVAERERRERVQRRAALDEAVGPETAAALRGARS